MAAAAVRSAVAVQRNPLGFSDHVRRSRPVSNKRGGGRARGEISLSEKADGQERNCMSGRSETDVSCSVVCVRASGRSSPKNSQEMYIFIDDLGEIWIR